MGEKRLLGGRENKATAANELQMMHEMETGFYHDEKEEIIPTHLFPPTEVVLDP